MNGPIWDNAAQGSDGWLKARQGILTASRMVDAMDFLKGGKGESEKRRQLKIDLMAERITGLSVPHFVNDAMKWGIDHEQEARSLYEDFTGNIVMECGLALHGEIPFFGASPDGLIHDGEGLVEIKCPTSKTHLQWVLAGGIPEQHKPQMLAQLAVTRRRYCDFVSYDPRFPEPQNRIIKRFEPTTEEIKAVEDAARLFLSELEQMWEQLTTGEIA